MPNLLQTVFLLCAIILTFIWLNSPSLHPYSLQLFALTVAVFFISKRLNKAKLWHIAPEHASLEVSLITLALLLLIGDTGNLSSPFFALAYVNLFFLVLACRPATAIIATIAMMLFYAGLAGTITIAGVQTLVSLPVILLIFLFTKSQYDEAQASQAIIVDESKNLEVAETNEESLEQFLTIFLQPRVQTLANLIETSATTREMAIQLSLINSEIEKLLNNKLKKTSTKD